LNKVYFFSDKDRMYGGTFIASANCKEAKNYALKSPIIELLDLDNPFIELRGHMFRRDGKSVETAYKGELRTAFR